MSPDTETLILQAITDMRADVTSLTREVSKLRERAAHEDGLDRGLALARRVEHVETELADRPTTRQIGEMFDNRIRRLTTRLIAGAFAGIPVWMGAGVALTALLSR